MLLMLLVLLVLLVAGSWLWPFDLLADSAHAAATSPGRLLWDISATRSLRRTRNAAPLWAYHVK